MLHLLPDWAQDLLTDEMREKLTLYGLDDWRFWATIGVAVVCITAIWVAAIWADRQVDRRVIDLDAPVQCGDITMEHLARHDGSDPFLPIYVAIRGKVYDVTKGKAFYGRDGGYSVFAGKEVARALAVMSVNEKDCTGDLEGLTHDQLKCLEEWERKFEKKYGLVGQVVPPKELTAAQLAEYNGENGKPIYLAVKGRIFDVSSGRQYYGPDGMYPFGGKECARALATYSTDVANCNDRLDDLGVMELDMLRDWEARFESKYPVVGVLLADKKND